MNRFLKFAAIVQLGAHFGSAHATAIRFDDLAVGVVVTNQYPEATFSSDIGFENVTRADFNLGTSLPNYICTRLVSGELTCSDPTIVTFTFPVNNLRFFQAGDNFEGVVAKVDVFQNNVYSATVDVLGDNMFFVPNLVDLSAFTNVTSIRIHTITDGGGLAWDDFTFDGFPIGVESQTWSKVKSIYAR